jgi:hypothetical protein
LAERRAVVVARAKTSIFLPPSRPLAVSKQCYDFCTRGRSIERLLLLLKAPSSQLPTVYLELAAAAAAAAVAPRQMEAAAA